VRMVAEWQVFLRILGLVMKINRFVADVCDRGQACRLKLNTTRFGESLTWEMGSQRHP